MHKPILSLFIAILAMSSSGHPDCISGNPNEYFAHDDVFQPVPKSYFNHGDDEIRSEMKRYKSCRDKVAAYLECKSYGYHTLHPLFELGEEEILPILIEFSRPAERFKDDRIERNLRIKRDGGGYLDAWDNEEIKRIRATNFRRQRAFMVLGYMCDVRAARALLEIAEDKKEEDAVRANVFYCLSCRPQGAPEEETITARVNDYMKKMATDYAQDHKSGYCFVMLPYVKKYGNTESIALIEALMNNLPVSEKGIRFEIRQAIEERKKNLIVEFEDKEE